MKRRDSSRLSGLGFEFAAGVAGLSLFGYWIGGFYDNRPMGLLIGALLGIAGGMYNLIRASLASSRQAKEPPEDDSEGPKPNQDESR